MSNLSNASMKIGQAIYAKKGDDAPPSDDDSNSTSDKKKEDTQEAEFTEKKK